jgi:transposase
MHPERLQGILHLADLQDDFVLLDYKKFKEQKRVVLVLGRKQQGGNCSHCGTLCSRIHSKDRVWLRDLSAFGYEIHLHADRFTFRCESCQQNRVEIHWLWRPRKSFTWRYEKHISAMCEEMTNASVSRLEKLNDKTIYTIDYELLELRLGHQKLPENLGPHYSMDEVYFRYFPEWHKDVGKKYVTNLLDLTHAKIISNSPGRDQKAAENCLILGLSPTQRRRAESVATDLHEPYHLSIRRHCPNADIVLDRFHIMQLFNAAMDEFRKHQLSLAQAQSGDDVWYLKGSNKWLLLTREEKLSKTNKKLLEDLKKINERVIDALLVREYFIQFFEAPFLREAKIRWYKLLKLVQEIDIPAFTEFFRKLRAWSPQLWNYFKHKTSSAVIEAVNHKIKVVKAQAYGYRNLRYFQLKILQRCGFLNTQFAPLPRIHEFQAKSA